MEPFKEDVEFLEHFGVKGMKWGVRRVNSDGNARNLGNRNNDRAQKLFDRISRVASGNASKRDKLITGLYNVNVTDLVRAKGSVQGASKLVLDRATKNQAKIANGKNKVNDILAKVYGVNVSQLDFSYD